MLKYPELPHIIAASLVPQLVTRSRAELLNSAEIDFSGVIYPPIGGNRASGEHLTRLRKLLRDAARKYGYPDLVLRSDMTLLDADWAEVLHRDMGISPWAASHDGLWQFICCVLVPDLVRVRFPGSDSSGTQPDRFLGGVRNTFGRLWWRAYTFCTAQTGRSPYSLLKRMHEDELVQIMERPNLAGDVRLTQETCRIFLEVVTRHGCERMTLMREVQKRIMRLFPMVSFVSLSDKQLDSLLRDIFEVTARSLARS
jgi:hypothetical protein